MISFLYTHVYKPVERALPQDLSFLRNCSGLFHWVARFFSSWTNFLPSSSISYVVLTPDDFDKEIHDVAVLRIKIFKEFPYLYEGDLDTETQYLASYRKSPSIIVLAKKGSEVIGAITGTSLENMGDDYINPFVQKSLDTSSCYYLGDLIVEAAYRGQGIGKRIYEIFEEQIRKKSGFSYLALCQIERNSNHPAKPTSYRDSSKFWQDRGFTRRDDIPGITVPWKELGQQQDHLLVFSTKSLQG